MKTIMRLMLVGLVVVVAAPSYAGGQAWQSFTCQVLDDTTEDQVLAAAAEWLKAAKSMKGGENLTVHVAFPVAAQMGEDDFRMLLTAPTIQEWGTFWDGYSGSAAAEVDDKYKDMIDCPDSRLFEVVEIK
jgi:hypothetical protein